MIKEITIDGVEYVPKSEPPLTVGDFKIVRTRSAGVFAGVVVSRDGSECTMSNARRLWYWKGAASLSELAMRGVACPEECKFPIAVPSVTLLEVIEILEVTEAARLSIEEVEEWSEA